MLVLQANIVDVLLTVLFPFELFTLFASLQKNSYYWSIYYLYIFVEYVLIMQFSILVWAQCIIIYYPRPSNTTKTVMPFRIPQWIINYTYELWLLSLPSYKISVISVICQIVSFVRERNRFDRVWLNNMYLFYILFPFSITYLLGT